jgi:hypothetical protein
LGKLSLIPRNRSGKASEIGYGSIMFNIIKPGRRRFNTIILRRRKALKVEISIIFVGSATEDSRTEKR